MPVSVGLDLGPYRITSRLGAGGMGEVWLAHDMRLGRDVAIKTIPNSITLNAELAARFEREARLLAALNHHGIAAVYGYEEFGSELFIILEYVPGETLAQIIARGKLDVRQSLELAVQLADAIEAAHARSIIHRDLKPSNIKITPEGKLKALDFGLAKALAPVQSAMAAAANSTETFTLDSTKLGTVMGTPWYMSPEQARGKALDRQTDIWSFGCVLFEMLSGRMAFGGETMADALSGVLEREPAWSDLPPSTPHRVRELLRRCLAKNQRQRFHDIADARIELEEILRDPWPDEAAAAARPRWAKPALFAAIPLAALAGFLLSALVFPSRKPPAQPLVAALLAPKVSVAGTYIPNLAVSASGTRFAFVAASGRLCRRVADSPEFIEIPGTEGASGPFFSPDGATIAFFASGKLRRVAFDGGPVADICDAPNPRGGAWGAHNEIVFAPTNHSGLSMIQADGGPVRPLTRVDTARGEKDHRLPAFLPDGTTVLFTINTSAQFENARIEAVSPDGKRHPVLNGGYAPQYAAGYLFYAHRGSVLAAPFNPRTLAPPGPAVPVFEGVVLNAITGSAQFHVSASGTLVYIPAEKLEVQGTLLSVDRHGIPRPLTDTKKPYYSPAFSPDGSRLAVAVAEGDSRSVWTADLARGGTLSRLTLRKGVDGLPVWSPDGKQIVFTSDEGGSRNLFRIPADGSGPPERLTTSPSTQVAGSWTPDGRTLLYEESDPVTGWDIWALPFDSAGRPGKPWPVVRTAFSDDAARLSPDGKWLAYVTDDSGQDEVVVRPFPDAGAKLPVSTAGGSQPVWSRNGKELFFRQADRLFAVDITTTPHLAAGFPRVLFAGDYDLGRGPWNYDVSPAGDRFVMIKGSEQVSGGASVVAMLNWTDHVAAGFSAAKNANQK